jgi:hypothetical protein
MVVLCLAGGMVGLLAWAIMKRDERQLLTYSYTPEIEREILQSLYTPAEVHVHTLPFVTMFDDTPWEMPDMPEDEIESDAWYDKADMPEDEPLPAIIDKTARRENGTERYYTDEEWLLENAVITILDSIADRLLSRPDCTDIWAMLTERQNLGEGIRKDIEQTQAWFLAYRLTKDHATLGHLVLRH